MERKQVLIERRNAVARIIINRPEKRNSISVAAIRELIDAFEELRNDNSISVVLTTGAGDDAYCAGRDLTEFPTDFSKPAKRAPRLPSRRSHSELSESNDRCRQRLLSRRRHYAALAP